jgi:hypothetical protein
MRIHGEEVPGAKWILTYRKLQIRLEISRYSFQWWSRGGGRDENAPHQNRTASNQTPQETAFTHSEAAHRCELSASQASEGFSLDVN